MSSRELVVANPITVAPEAMPAFSPLKESSNTYVVSGVVPKTSIPNRKQSGAGLEAVNISVSKDTVEKSLYFGMNLIDSRHLRFVGAGHYGSLHPIPV